MKVSKEPLEVLNSRLELDNQRGPMIIPQLETDPVKEKVAAALMRAASSLTLPPGAVLRVRPVSAACISQLPTVIIAAAKARQDSFWSGRSAALSALAAAGGPTSDTLGIGVGGMPEWPRGWLGSISHSDILAAAIVAPLIGEQAAQVLGLDLERVVTPDVALEIAPEIMPEAVPGNAGLPIELEVTRVFSAKEALFKALFPRTGQFKDFSAARVLWRASANTEFTTDLTLTEAWGPEFPAGMNLLVRQTMAMGHIFTIVWQ